MTSWPEVNARRLARHGLTTPLASFPEAAAAMAGAHAQVMSAAEVSLALRVTDTTRADVAAALWEERSLVKTFGPRGTVHVLPAADLSWWLSALGSVPKSGGHPEGVRLLPDGRPPGERLRQVRWMLEELRVSLWAQQLGTAYPVSEQRIRKALAT